MPQQNHTVIKKNVLGILSFFLHNSYINIHFAFKISASLKREICDKAKLLQLSAFCFRTGRWCNLFQTIEQTGFYTSPYWPLPLPQFPHFTFSPDFLCLRQKMQTCGLSFMQAWNIQKVLLSCECFYFHVAVQWTFGSLSLMLFPVYFTDCSLCSELCFCVIWKPARTQVLQHWISL